MYFWWNLDIVCSTYVHCTDPVPCSSSDSAYRTDSVFLIRDPELWPLYPGSRMGKNPDPGTGMNILDHISESLVTVDPGSGMEKFGSGIRGIRNTAYFTGFLKS